LPVARRGTLLPVQAETLFASPTADFADAVNAGGGTQQLANATGVSR